MAARDPDTKAQTTEFLRLLATAVFNLETSPLVWEELIRMAKEDLNTLTRVAALSVGEEGLHTAGYQTRAQELVIRLDILEEFVAHINQSPSNITQDNQEE